MNEAEIFIDDVRVTAVIDTGTKVSAITQDFCLEHWYEFQLVTQMLQLEGMGGINISYLGYVKAVHQPIL